MSRDQISSKPRYTLVRRTLALNDEEKCINAKERQQKRGLFLSSKLYYLPSLNLFSEILVYIGFKNKLGPPWHMIKN